MRRRTLITCLGAAVVWPLAVGAQQPKIPRVGYVWIGSANNDSPIAGLSQGLADRGYVLGRSLLLDVLYAEGNPGRIPKLIDELLALDVDVLVTPGTPTSLAAHKATLTVPSFVSVATPSASVSPPVCLIRAATSRACRCCRVSIARSGSAR